MSSISAPNAAAAPANASVPVSRSTTTGGISNPRIAAAKPRITIQIPPPAFYAGATPNIASPAQYAKHSPMSPALLRAAPASGGETPAVVPSLSGTGAGSPYVNPFSSMMYPTTGFMFKQFEGLKDFTFASAKSGLNIGEKSAFYIYEKFSKWSRKWFTHCFLFLVILLYSVAGAFLFVALEGETQQNGIIFVRELKHEFSEKLYVLAQDKKLVANLAEWQGAVDRELLAFVGNLTDAIKAGSFDEDQTVKPPTWSFWNAMFYCGTIYTTIGYGHIYPKTNAGRALTIAYAIIGIPMFLILLADFGKLFTRAIKVLWRYVRRLYYTGSLRRVRKQAQVQEVLRGMNIAYEVATFRRPSMIMRDAPDLSGAEEGNGDGSLHPPVGDESPTTPVPTEIDVNDEEFNLPISLAIFLLLAYIVCGAAVYTLWEDWTFFEAAYFVFISMSTIGFGDYVPKHPMFMMASIVYLVFGLALTSMCINVVQVKLSDSFRQASAKISASIGLVMAEAAEEEARRSQGTLTPSVQAPIIDMPPVHQAGGRTTNGASTLPVHAEEPEDDGPSKDRSPSPPALPPKKITLTNEPNDSSPLPSDEVKKRRKFWK